MHYRHAFHAGNHADVLKHAVLVRLLRALLAEPSPLCVIDTHAGAGRYDLHHGPAATRAEADAGVYRLLASGKSAPLLAEYLAVIRDINAGLASVQRYPGSPWLALRLLRPTDRYVGFEMVADVFRELEACAGIFATARLVLGNGYDQLRHFLPPPAMRGLILIDPPYEYADEQARLGEALELIRRQKPDSCIALWYPVKDQADEWKIEELALNHSDADIIRVRLMLHEWFFRGPLPGSGMIVINPPPSMDGEWHSFLGQLAASLHAPAQEGAIQWLRAKRHLSPGTGGPASAAGA